jgi:hypothetical protein
MLETLLNFRNIDSTENLNARLAGLIPKGIVKGGLVVPEPASLQVRIKGDGNSPFVLLAFADDGMVIRERNEEHVLSLVAGITSVVVLRAKYVASLGDTIARFEVLPLGSYLTDPNPETLIRLCSVTPPAGATAILSEHINMSYRDSIEGFSRKIVRDVVGTKEDLPAVSGFPAIAELNFLHNNFAFNSEVRIGTGSGIVSYPIVSPINFRVAEPSVPGLSRLHPEQFDIVSVVQNAITGKVTVLTDTAHGYSTGVTVRISGNSASQANQVWQILDPILDLPFTADESTNSLAAIGHGCVTGLKVRVSSSDTLPTGLLPATDYYAIVLSANTLKLSDTRDHALAGTNVVEFSDNGLGVHTLHPQTDTVFYFDAPLTLAWSGTGGTVVDITIGATVTAKLAAGVTHSLTTGNEFTLTNPTDRTFEGLFTVTQVIDAQTITYTQTGYPSADTGNGTIQKQGTTLPANAVEIGESATQTAANFEIIFNSSLLGPDIRATAIGSSLQFVSTNLGVIGNSYTIEKSEPNYDPSEEAIVLSGSTFAGGVDPNPTATLIDLIAGDIYVVLSGDSGTLEIWGYDGIIFRNLTSSSTATMLDFHRRNLFLNEKHLTENEKAALAGTVGVPSSINKFVTQEDTSVLTSTISAALQGADNEPPSGNNRYLTEARLRAERGEVEIPAGQNWVEVPISDGLLTWDLLVGSDGTGTDSTKAIPFFNIVFTDSLLNAGGFTEYSQIDFTPVIVEAVYVTKTSEPEPPPFLVELNPEYPHLSSDGVFPRPDAVLLDYPTRLWVKLNTIPDNGSATLLYSKVLTEKNRGVASDMYATPQRIIPAQVQDIINRSQELRFNAGIKVSGTTVEFPANLFRAINLQGLKLNRVVGSKTTLLDGGFTLDLQTGLGGGVVTSFDPVEFTALTAGQWTRYHLAVTPNGTIEVRHIEPVLETSTCLAYSSTLSSVSTGSMPYEDGSYVFASVAVKSTGVIGTAIETLTISNIEVYPYQATNEKDYAAPIICGDGISSFGHFTGTDAHIRAFAWAKEGSRIVLRKGTYDGNLVINKSDIIIEGQNAILTSITDQTAITTICPTTLRNLEFRNCVIAIDVQGGAENCNYSGIVFGSGVTTKIKAPAIYSFGSGDTDPVLNTITVLGHTLVEGAEGVFSTTGSLPTGLTAGVTYYVRNPDIGSGTFQVSLSLGGAIVPLLSTGNGNFGDGRIYGLEAKTKFNQWVVSDGSNTYGVGDFNSPNGIQQAHDAASEGDCILILAGVYRRFTVTSNRLQFKGIGGGQVRVNGEALADPCITVIGSYNQFDNLVLENAAVGIDCTSSGPVSATYNTFSSTVVFSSDITHAIKMPLTLTEKHYNYHMIVSGRIQGSPNLIDPNSPEVTVGDGIISWGDYVGEGAIQLAINNESEGTKIVVRAGDYTPFSVTKNNLCIEGSGARSVIRANAPSDEFCIEVINPPVSDGGNKVSGFYLLATQNETLGNLETLGIRVTGNDNIFENIKFESTGDARIELHKKYQVTSGFRNRFVPHTGAPTGYISWTVGDGVRSFGDFNGANGITQALNALPTIPSGASGVLSASSGDTVNFSDPSVTFNVRDLYRYITVTSSGLGNEGSYKIISIVDPNTVSVIREDGGTFSNEGGVHWSFLTGAKIWVLPGQYDGGASNFNILSSINDVDIEAWGGGDDTLIVGDSLDNPLLSLAGNRCRIKGFRFVGGDPVNGIAIEVTGNDNTFESNVYDTAIRFDLIGLRNRVFDAPEAQDRTSITVSTAPSRGDYVGMDEQVVQDAVIAAYNDPHINKVVLGKGTWVFNDPVQIPSGVILEGSGYDTVIMNGGGVSMAFDLLDDGGGIGGQTITGIRFGAFPYSVSVSGVAVSEVIAYNNWIAGSPAPIDVANITGLLTMNL